MHAYLKRAIKTDLQGIMPETFTRTIHQRLRIEPMTDLMSFRIENAHIRVKSLHEDKKTQKTSIIYL